MEAIGSAVGFQFLAGPLAAAGAMTPSQITLLVIVVGFSIVMLIVTRRRIASRQHSPRAYVREQISRIKEEQGVTRRIDDLMVELAEVSRQIHAQIDTRFAKLDSAIRAADQRIDALTRLVDPLAEDVAGSDDERATATAGQTDRTRHFVYELADAGRDASQIAHQVGRTVGEVELMLAVRHKTPSGA
jgi:hypothetical protein